MRRKNLAKILMEELNYTPYEAQITVDDLENLTEPLDGLLALWVADRSVGDYRVDEYTVKDLMDAGYTFPAALIAMDWLILDPDEARTELKRNYE